jgi:hypothetical protein
MLPLGVSGIFGAAQLFLGADPWVVVLCLAALTVTFVPLHLNGRDLYSLLAVVFGVRYLGVALLAKTAYGQPLQTNLFHPYATYTLAFILMVSITAVLMLARACDFRKSAISFANDLPSLRRLALISFAIGIIGLAVVGVLKTDDPEAKANAGVLFFLASHLSGLCVLALVAEAAYGLAKSNGRSLFTPLLIAMLGITQLAVIALNTRQFMLSCIIGVAAVAFIYRMLKFRYIVIATVFAAFFGYFLTPLTLHLRPLRRMPIAQFIGLAEDTFIREVVDPDFRQALSNEVDYSAIESLKTIPAYDYYGNRSNVLNRLSYVALLDAVYNGTQSRKELEMDAVGQSVTHDAPGVLGFHKPEFPFSDWLSWQVGMSESGYIANLNFGLPMEGLATWGEIGLIAYPFIFLFPVLAICARISSLRLALPASIYIFADLQHVLVEGDSSAFLSILLRSVPLTIITLYILCFVSGRPLAHLPNMGRTRRGIRSIATRSSDPPPGNGSSQRRLPVRPPSSSEAVSSIT